jgi:hypothetical protein
MTDPASRDDDAPPHPDAAPTPPAASPGDATPAPAAPAPGPDDAGPIVPVNRAPAPSAESALADEAALLLRHYPRKRARATLVAQGYSETDADAALAAAAGPRRAQRLRRFLRLLAVLVVSLLIAAGAVAWRPGEDHGPRALGMRLMVTLGWLWVAGGGLGFLRWFVRRHGIFVLILAPFRPVRTVRTVLSESDEQDLIELEMPFFGCALGLILIAIAAAISAGPGTVTFQPS